MTNLLSNTQYYHRRALIIFAICVCLFFGLNIFAQTALKNIRFDFTQDQLYTLSDTSKNIIKNLNEPIKIEFFYSESIRKKVPVLGLYADRIQSFLKDLENLSEGKLQVLFYNPTAFSDLEDRAVQAGIQAIPLDASGETVYFGIAGYNSVDKKEVIPYLQPEREVFLEYDLSKLIHGLNQTSKQNLTLLTSLPIAGTPPNPMMGIGGMPSWKIYDHLSNFYNVDVISPESKALPEKTDILMLLHPKNITSTLLYDIDQFVLSGGSIFLCLDPLSEVENSMSGQAGIPGADTASYSSDFDLLLKKWGIVFSQNFVVGDINFAERVNAGTQNEVKPVSYLPWLNISNQYFNKDNAVIGSLSNMKMISVGHFKYDQEQNPSLIVSPLIQTSSEAQEIPISSIHSQPDPVALLQNFKPEGSFDLAIDVSGTFETAFPGKQQQAEGKTHLIKSVKPAHIILVGDSDFLFDIFWISTQDFFGTEISVPTSSNADFIFNSLESLSAGQSFASLRSRGQAYRPFTHIEEIQTHAEATYLTKEQELQTELAKTQEELASLEQFQSSGSSATLNEDQEKAIQNFRSKMIKIRKDLRNVQKNLRKDIEDLMSWLQFINIFAIPILLGIFALIMGYLRKKKRSISIIHTT